MKRILNKKTKFFYALAKIKKIKNVYKLHYLSYPQHDMTVIWLTIKPPITKKFVRFNTGIEDFHRIANVEIKNVHIANRGVQIDYVFTIR